MGIKISQIIVKKEELLRSLRGVESPGKRKLIISIKNENWIEVIEELLFRIELYTSERVITYNRKTINDIVKTISVSGVNKLAEKLLDKAYHEFKLSEANIFNLINGKKLLVWEETMDGMVGETMFYLSYEYADGTSENRNLEDIKELFKPKDYVILKDWIDELSAHSLASARSAIM